MWGGEPLERLPARRQLQRRGGDMGRRFSLLGVKQSKKGGPSLGESSGLEERRSIKRNSTNRVQKGKTRLRNYCSAEKVLIGRHTSMQGRRKSAIFDLQRGENLLI